MKQSKARAVARTGMLFALAMVLGWLENLLAPALGLPPGVKVGLANIAVLYALFFCSGGQALLLVLLKAGFGFITRGAMGGLLSLAGGLLSLGAMVLLLCWGRGRAGKGEQPPPDEAQEEGARQKPAGPSYFLVSVVGALCHNAGQMLVVRLFFGPHSLYYAPVLVAAGVVAGALTALSLRVLMPALSRL